jgi:chromate transporter
MERPAVQEAPHEVPHEAHGAGLDGLGLGWGAPIWVLSAQLVVLTFAALGGGLAMLMPELQRFVVLEHGWMNDHDFIAAFTIGQAAPGPNFLYVTLVGYRLAGIAGALLALLAVLVPPSLVCYAVLRYGEARIGTRFQRAVREGLAPVSAGLMLSFGWVLCSHVDTNWRAVLVTLITVAVFLRTRLNPVWLVLAGALLGLAGAVS